MSTELEMPGAGSTTLGTAQCSYEWAQVDVFAEAPLQGNMLAIFPNATGLTDAEMQALARETNLSETAFILPRSPAEERSGGVRVRLFTTEEELPFAGHPTLGTASWLRLNRPEWHHAPEVKLALNAGVVPVRFPSEQAGPGLYGEMRQLDPQFNVEFGGDKQREQVAAAVGLAPEELHPELHPQVVSTGLPFLMVPLRSVAAVQRIALRGAEFSAVMRAAQTHFAYVIAPVTEGESACGAQWHARMPMYSGEDPATGSAAGCLVSYLLRHRAARSGQAIVIQQGMEVRRPSRITARATLDGDRVGDVRVAGRTIPVASGRFFLG